LWAGDSAADFPQEMQDTQSKSLKKIFEQGQCKGEASHPAVIQYTERVNAT